MFFTLSGSDIEGLILKDNTVACGRVIQSYSQLTNMQKCIFWTMN